MQRKVKLSSSLLARNRKSPPLECKANGQKYTYVDDEIRYCERNEVSPDIYKEPARSPVREILIGKRYELPEEQLFCQEYYDVQHDPSKLLPAIKLNKTNRFVAREEFRLVKHGNEYIVKRIQ